MKSTVANKFTCCLEVEGTTISPSQAKQPKTFEVGGKLPLLARKCNFKRLGVMGTFGRGRWADCLSVCLLGWLALANLRFGRPAPTNSTTRRPSTRQDAKTLDGQVLAIATLTAPIIKSRILLAIWLTTGWRRVGNRTADIYTFRLYKCRTCQPKKGCGLIDV